MKTLSQYLKDAGQTQVEFAARLGTTQANVSKLCGLEAPPISLEMAVKIEAATGGEVPVEVWPRFACLAQRTSSETAPSSDASNAR